MQTEQDPEKKSDLESEKKALKSYARYTGMAFQMLAIIGLAVFIGFKLDAWLAHEVQWATALGGVLGVCLAIYQIIKQLK